MFDQMLENPYLLVPFSLLIGVGLPVAGVTYFRYLNEPKVTHKQKRKRKRKRRSSED